MFCLLTQVLSLSFTAQKLYIVYILSEDVTDSENCGKISNERKIVPSQIPPAAITPDGNQFYCVLNGEVEILMCFSLHCFNFLILSSFILLTGLFLVKIGKTNRRRREEHGDSADQQRTSHGLYGGLPTKAARLKL